MPDIMSQQHGGEGWKSPKTILETVREEKHKLSGADMNRVQDALFSLKNDPEFKDDPGLKKLEEFLDNHDTESPNWVDPALPPGDLYDLRSLVSQNVRKSADHAEINKKMRDILSRMEYGT